jgi:large subunit ribosomal protein L24
MFLGSARRLIRKRPIQNFKKWKILRGDEVIVVTGRDKGKRGVVRSILRTKNKVLVDGVNYARKRVPAASGVRGGHVSVEQPLPISNVALVDPASGALTKVAFRYVDGAKVRVSKKSGSIIARPDILLDRVLPLRDAGPHDTLPSDVMEQTYHP